VLSTYSEADRWQSGWFPIGGTAPVTMAGQRVAAAWRNAAHLDLFITGRDGKVWSTYFDNNRWQSAWFPVTPASISVSSGQPVTAVWRNPNHLDLFVTDSRGQVMSTFFENNSWSAGWFAIGANSGSAASGQPITALWRDTAHLDLFMTGRDGRIMSTYFEGTQWQPAWFPIAPGTAKAAPGQEVSAVWAPTHTHLDLFVTADDGRVMSIFFENNRWAGAWFAI